ncbi:hypothetical protein V1511DRAFT_24026 [Dipodascopsis uninucleata]
MTQHAIVPIFHCKPGSRDNIVEKLKVMQSYVLANEPKCLAYYFIKSIDDPNLLLGFEVYNEKEDLTANHLESETFKAFLDSIQVDVEKDLIINHFKVTDIGFVSRPKFSQLQGPDIFNFVVFIKTVPGKREEVLNIFKPVADAVLADEVETCYSYKFSVAEDDDDTILIFERYVNAHALEVIHRGGEKFKEAFAKFDELKLIVGRTTYSCSESGMGFLGRD